MLLSIPNTQIKSMHEWTNYSGTLGIRAIPIFCTPEPLTLPTSQDGALLPHGAAIRGILGYCFSQQPPASLRALGTTLSFSRVVEPDRVAVDSPYMNALLRVTDDTLTEDYRNARVT